MLKNYGPELLFASETWEREKFPLSELLSKTPYESISFRRPKINKGQPGGGCALIFNGARFSVSELDVPIPTGVETKWAVLRPKLTNKPAYKVK